MPFPLVAYLLILAVGLGVVLLQVVVLLASKVRIEEFHFFYGQPLATFDLGSVQLKLGWIPMGFSLKYDNNQFALLPAVGRVALHLVSAVILLGLGFSLLGLEGGWHHFVTGFRQMVEGVLHPQTVGYVLMEKLHALYRQSPVAMVGVISMKWVAWSLLPIGYAAGPALHQIFSPSLRPRENVEKLVSLGMMVGFLATMVWVGIFAVYAVKHWA